MRRNSKSEFLKGIGTSLALAVAVLLAQTGLFAQSTGTVTGTVYDQSGAVVPKANVELVNDATQDTRKSTSNAEGYFSFASNQPGSYTVRVTASGFKGWEQGGIPVRPGDVRDVNNIKLEVGSQGETISVEAVADEIAPVDSGERSSVLTAKQIENLSLEGRDATELIRTLPGFSVYSGSISNTAQDFQTVSPTGGAVGQGYVGNGAPYRGGTDLVSDGAHIIDNGCNCGATQTVNGDMVAEVKVQTSNFGADSAKGPIVINAVGKSGSTAYHGEFVMHARNGALNSQDWAFNHVLKDTGPTGANSNGLVKAPASSYLYPGAQFGGPVPGTNKKLVFFVGYEYYYQHGIPFATSPIQGLLTDVVPTMSMRGLDASGNPLATGADYSSNQPDNAALCNSGGNQGQVFCALDSLQWWNQAGTTQSSTSIIPTTEIDPGGAALMQHGIPFPNANPANTGGYNLLVPENVDQNAYTFHTRVDYNISDSTKLYVSYNMQKESDQSPIHLWWTPPNSIPFPGGLSSRDNSQTLSGHFLHVFSPTLTNEVTSGLGYINYPLKKNNKDAWSATANGYPYKTIFGDPNSGKFGPTNSNMMPGISNGYWVAGVPFMDQQDIFENGGGTFSWKKWNLTVEDNLTKSYKTHTIKLGFYYERTTNDQGAFTPLQGEASFQPFASNNCDDGQGSVIKCGSNNPVADILLGTASTNFTQVNKAALDSLWYPTISGFVQDDWKVTKRLTLNLGLRGDHLGAWTPFNSFGVATWTGDLTAPGPNDKLPGITWHGFSSKIPLAGRDVDVITWQPRLGLALDLRGNGKTVLRGGWGEYGYRDQWNDYATPADLSQGVITYNSPGAIKFSQINALNGFTPPASGTASAVMLHDHKQPISRSYNLTISQQTPWNTLLEVGYVGSQTRNEVLRPGSPGPANINFIPMGGLFALHGCTAPCADPGGSADYAAYAFGNSTYTNNPINLVQHLALANYNALQMSWARQRGRISYNLNYTWSKSLGTQGQGGGAGSGQPPDATNYHHDYGVLATDRSHVVNLSYTFQTGNPVRGNKFLQGAANGWNLSGITTWQSGPDMQEQGASSGASSDYGLNVGGSVLDPTGNSVTVAGNTWLGTPNVSLQPTVLCDPTAHLHAHQYINMSCFGMPAPGTNGTYQLPYVHGPAFFNSDLAVFKTFKLTERQAMEFRVSAFNFLNHPLDSFQIANGDLKLNFNASSPANGVYNFANASAAATPPPGVSTLGNKNVYPGYASTRYGKRIMEFSLKYSF